MEISNKQKAVALLKSIETGDTAPFPTSIRKNTSSTTSPLPTDWQVLERLKNTIAAFMIVAGFAACTSNSTDNSTQQQNDEAAIKTLLENYKASINQADTTLAKTFWLTTGQASFIHPRGHEKGWENIKKGIYEMFGSRFAQRDLKSFDETITQYGDMAVLEFYWIFDASFADGDPIQTKGRETQVLKKTGGEWRLVHVHYSGMPATGEREGF